MTVDFGEQSTKSKGGHRPHRSLATNRLLQLGVFAAIFLVALNTPWVQQFSINAASGDPLVGIGYWCLLALFTSVLAWNVLRNMAYDRKGLRIGVQISLALAWVAWISWLTNDRLNASSAFDRLGVVWNVIFVGLFALLLVAPIVWFDWVRERLRERRSKTGPA